jgi:Holliday junction resolvase RusA-like endonuclease
MRIEFFVQGSAKPAGSKRGFAIKQGGQYTGRVVVQDASGEAGRIWRQDVKAAAREAYQGAPLDCPLAVVAIFYQARPKAHFGGGRNAHLLKASAPRYPVSKPDTTKLFRAVEDALTGILWKDDCLIVAQQVRKKYCDEAHSQPGVLLRVETWA